MAPAVIQKLKLFRNGRPHHARADLQRHDEVHQAGDQWHGHIMMTPCTVNSWS
jgi:hypothetical protein